jgi:Domain of unknown function (DUF4365)
MSKDYHVTEALSVSVGPYLIGSPQRKSNFQENLHESTLFAIAAAAGCAATLIKTDEGIDVLLTHKSESHTALSDRLARLEIQLKSTSSPKYLKEEFIAIPVENKIYDDYRIVPRGGPHRIFVFMEVPKEQRAWITADSIKVSIFHAMYWVNIAGHPTMESKSITIKAPRSQLLTPESLSVIMERIGKGGKP